MGCFCRLRASGYWERGMTQIISVVQRQKSSRTTLPKPREREGIISFLGPPGLKWVAGPASNPTSVAEAASSVTQGHCLGTFLVGLSTVWRTCFLSLKGKTLERGEAAGDYFYLGCLLQSFGVLPRFKHGIHNTVKNNPLIEQKAWERGDSQAI